MRLRLFAVIVLGASCATLMAPPPGFAQGPISPTTEASDVSTSDPVESMIKRGILVLTNERFDEALEIFQKLIDHNKDDPRGHFYKAAVLSVTMQDYKTRAFESEFYLHINEAIEKAESRIEAQVDDAEAHFYLGGAYGYRGIDKTMIGNWLSAFLDGTRGVFHLQQALSFNPKYYDAYYGLGAYHYWVSARSSLLWFLPFFSDERDRGIEELRLAGSKGLFAQYEARASLVTVLINEERWEEARQEAEALIDKFPDDLSSHIQRGHIMASLGRWDEVTREFRWIKGFLANRPYHGYMRDLEAEYYLALSAQRQSHSQDFFDTCLKVNELMENDQTRAFIEGLGELEQRARELCGGTTPPP